MAAYELTNLGFKSGVRVLKGGFNEWRKSGRCRKAPSCVMLAALFLAVYMWKAVDGRGCA